jgi:hypothetical protein
MMKQQYVVAFRFPSAVEHRLSDLQRELFSELAEPACRLLPPLIPLATPGTEVEISVGESYPVGAVLRLQEPVRRDHALIIPVHADPAVHRWLDEHRRGRPGSRDPESPRLIEAHLHVLLCLRCEYDGSPPALAVQHEVRAGTIELIDMEYETDRSGRPVAIYRRSCWSVPVRKGSATTTRFRPDSLAQ